MGKERRYPVLKDYLPNAKLTVQINPKGDGSQNGKEFKVEIHNIVTSVKQPNNPSFEVYEIDSKGDRVMELALGGNTKVKQG